MRISVARQRRLDGAPHVPCRARGPAARDPRLEQDLALRRIAVERVDAFARQLCHRLVIELDHHRVELVLAQEVSDERAPSQRVSGSTLRNSSGLSVMVTIDVITSTCVAPSGKIESLRDRKPHKRHLLDIGVLNVNLLGEIAPGAPLRGRGAAYAVVACARADAIVCAELQPHDALELAMRRDANHHLRRLRVIQAPQLSEHVGPRKVWQLTGGQYFDVMRLQLRPAALQRPCARSAA